ncbi:MAG: type II toxin-antitoxin system VapC family toxin, partial [Thermoanaerobaculia bacterium]
MIKVVVDASVAIKWFVPEIHSLAAARLLDPAVYVLAPDLIGPEIGNTLWKKMRRAEITQAEASDILSAMETI